MLHMKVFSCLLTVAIALPTPLERATAAVDGLFEYYQRRDPKASAPPATFFFACGQIGGSAPDWLLPISANECACESGDSYACVNCYRWWSAVALESLASYAIASGVTPADSAGARIIEAAQSTWEHAPYNGFWNATEHPTWVDDFAWYGLAYMRVYDWTGDSAWRDRALGLLEWGEVYGWDEAETAGGSCGGYWWSLHANQRFKDSISIVELLHLAARLAGSAADPREREWHLQTAERVWAWLSAFDHGRGLLAPDGIMSTGAQPAWCCAAAAASSSRANGSACTNSDVPGEAYNHGILLSSAALLHNLTGSTKYLEQVRRLAASAAANLTNAHGAPADVQRGSRSQAAICNATNGFDPGSDFFSFKGIFAAHVGYAATALAASGALSAGLRSNLLGLVRAGSEMAWTRSAAWPPFDPADRCDVQARPAAAMPATSHPAAPAQASAPKFHWWWTSGEEAPLQTPPDPRLWLLRGSMRCHYSSALWSGAGGSLADCQEQCAARDSCHVFVFANLTLMQPEAARQEGIGYTLQCKLFAPVADDARESEPGCAEQASSDYVVGARRPRSADRCTAPTPAPVGVEECAARPQDAANASCRCDVACTRHLDCCTDYVQACLPEAEHLPSCAGRCVAPGQQLEAIPIPGGGYCAPTTTEPPRYSSHARYTPPTAHSAHPSAHTRCTSSLCECCHRPSAGFCDEACENDFTDNNSHGGCCADYKWQCEGGERDPLCMDARTQAQAINVFVAHHVIEALT